MSPALLLKETEASQVERQTLSRLDIYLFVIRYPVTILRSLQQWKVKSIHPIERLFIRLFCFLLLFVSVKPSTWWLKNNRNNNTAQHSTDRQTDRQRLISVIPSTHSHHSHLTCSKNIYLLYISLSIICEKVARNATPQHLDTSMWPGHHKTASRGRGPYEKKKKEDSYKTIKL